MCEAKHGGSGSDALLGLSFREVVGAVELACAAASLATRFAGGGCFPHAVKEASRATSAKFRACVIPLL